jgi:hypothetical protein
MHGALGKSLMDEVAICDRAFARMRESHELDPLVRKYALHFESYLYDGNDKDFERAIKHAGIDKMPPEQAKIHRAAMQKAKDILGKSY